MQLTTLVRGVILGPLFGLGLAIAVEANSIQTINLVGELPSRIGGTVDFYRRHQSHAHRRQLHRFHCDFVQAPSGVSAAHQSHVPRAKRSMLVTSFLGPISKDYLARNVVTVLPLGSAANPKFLIVMNIEIDTTGNPTGQAQITLGSIDLKLTVPPAP